MSVTSAHRGVIEKTLTLTGTIQPLREAQASLSSPVAGVLDSLPARIGKTVSRGEVVAHLSTRLLEGQIEQARATIAQNTIQVQQAQANALQQQGQTRNAIQQAQTATSGARATLSGAQANLSGTQANLIGAEAALANARQTLARTEALFADGLVPQKDVETAQLAVRSADAQVAVQRQAVAAQRQAVAAQRETVKGQEQTVAAAQSARIQDTVKKKDVQIAEQQLQIARGALATAQAQTALYTLRAPISGTVTSVGASLGESVDTTIKLVTIANLDRVQLQIAVPAASVSAIRVGLPLQFTVDSLPGRAFQGTIRAIGSQADPTNNTILATALIDNPNHLLKSDLYARVQIVSARHSQAILVDRAALLQEVTTTGTENSVLRLEKDDVLKKVVVKTGFIKGNVIEIVSGLKPGDRVVTTGGYGLPDGTKVAVDGAAEKDAASKAAGEKP